MDQELPEVGAWAQDKLVCLKKYLAAYTTILSKQGHWLKGGYVFVDAFAGSGRAIVRAEKEDDAEPETGLPLDLGQEFRKDDDIRQVLDGSPRVALDIEPPFTQYVFVEKDPDRLRALGQIKKEYEGKRSIRIREGDCRAYIEDHLLQKVDWKQWRAVVFLDPFGMQVPWKTIAGLATTGAIEVFLNFPVGMAIQRLLKRSGKFTQKERAKLDEYFGDPGWYDVVYEQVQGLFQTETQKNEGSAEHLVDWYRDRLAKAFGFVSEAHLVRNSQKGHLYYLVFAGPNEKGRKIANDVLRGYGQAKNK